MRIFFDLLAEFHEERLLIVEYRAVAFGAMAGTNDRRAKLFCRLQCFEPLARVAVGQIVIRPVHTGVAGEQDFLLRQPREAVAVSVRDAQIM